LLTQYKNQYVYGNFLLNSDAQCGRACVRTHVPMSRTLVSTIFTQGDEERDIYCQSEQETLHK